MWRLRPLPAAVAALALLAAALPLPGPAQAGLPLAEGGGCVSPHAPVQALRDALQNDAASEADAPDCPAMALRLFDAAYQWGHVDFAGPEGIADLDDWYVADLSDLLTYPGHAMFNVTTDVLGYHTQGQVTGLLWRPALQLEVWAPGAAEPLVMTSCGQGTIQSIPGSGDWWFRVSAIPGALPCAPHPPSFALSPAPPPTATYGFYFGCHPVCDVE